MHVDRDLQIRRRNYNLVHIVLLVTVAHGPSRANAHRPSRENIHRDANLISQHQIALERTSPSYSNVAANVVDKSSPPPKKEEAVGLIGDIPAHGESPPPKREEAVGLIGDIPANGDDGDGKGDDNKGRDASGKNGNDQDDDGKDGGGKKSHGHADHANSHISASLLFTPAFLLSIGIATNAFASRYLPSIPYTCILFVEGCLIASINNVCSIAVIQILAEGIEVIQAADPHFVLCVFLPPLLFADAMNLNTAMLRRCFWQCITLAVPGVLIGTALTGVAVYYCLPYKWGWLKCFLFGSILSATDPVAVVAIFRSAGVSPKLTMLIGGESLFNDGTAVMVFQLLLLFADSKGKAMSTEELSKFMAFQLAGAPIVGFVVGKLFMRVIQWTSDRSQPADKTLQIVTTISCCYMGYIISEEVGSSGVIAVVVAGIVFAAYAEPIFLCGESVHRVWSTLEFMGNTLIFMISGVIFGDSFSSSKSAFQPGALDFGLLLAIYILAVLIRGVVCLILALPLNLVGSALSWRELLVITWCGLRGAVGLLMAVVVQEKKSLEMQQAEFFVGGFAALTLIVNGMLTPKLLTQLGMNRVSESQTQMLADVENTVLEKVRAHVEERFGDDNHALWFSDVPQDTMTEILSHLQPPTAETLVSQQTSDGDPADAKLEMLRSVLLRCVGHCYQELGKEYIIPKGCPVSRILFSATDFAMLSCDLPLSDWDTVRDRLLIGKYSTKEDYDEAHPLWKQSLGISWSFEKQQIYQAVACIAFSYAHTESKKMLCNFYGRKSGADTVEENTVCEESQKQVALANEVLESMDPELLNGMKAKMLATSTLVLQLDKLDHLTHMGVLAEKDTHKIAEPYHESLKALIADVYD